jgi:hypothetical protein
MAPIDHLAVIQAKNTFLLDIGLVRHARQLGGFVCELGSKCPIALETVSRAEVHQGRGVVGIDLDCALVRGS